MEHNTPPPIPNFYQAPAARVGELNAAPRAALVKAERGTRLGANLLDGLAAIVISSPLWIGVAINGGADKPSVISMALMVLGGLAVLGLFLYQLLLLYRHGQTLGKRQLGIRIVRSNGDAAEFSHLLLKRSLLPGVIGMIPLLGSLFGLANILWIFGDEKRCLHDLLADTIVVRV